MPSIHLTITYTAADFASACRSLPLGMSKLWIFPTMGILALLAGVLFREPFFAVAGVIPILTMVVYPFIFGFQMSRCPT